MRISYWSSDVFSSYLDRCLIISNMQVVERSFVEQMIATFERIFKLDENEFETMKDHSASMRRVFSRYKKFIPVIGRDGGYFKVMPHSDGRLEAHTSELQSLMRISYAVF